MNYPKIAAAELLETHGDRLFVYCWSMLRSRETAQTALRDTLLAAPAGATRSRLYSLARAACGQHRAVPAADADEAPVCLGRNDADNRLVAWNAAMSLEPAEFEALELGTRHEVDLGQVLGLPAGEAQALLTRATLNLERALGAEVLARRGHPCPDRAEVLAGWSGTMTPQLRDRVLEHAFGCEACTEARPRNVSAARVFSLLPAPALSPQARAELLGSRTAPPPEPAAPAEPAAPPVDLPLAALVQPPPSVTPLASRVQPVPAPRPVVPGPRPVARDSGPLPTFTPAPVPAARAPRGRRTSLVIAGVGAVASAVVITAGGRNRVLFTAVTQPLSPARAPATTRNSAAGHPAGPATSASPGALQLSAGSVNVGTGSAGRITLTALDGPVRWSASSSAPNQVSLGSTGGTLAAGQSVTLAVTVTRGTPAGSATLTFDSAASASQLVQITWSAPPGSGPVMRPVRHPRPYPYPTPSASSPAPSPSPTSASPSDTTVPDPSGS